MGRRNYNTAKVADGLVALQARGSRVKPAARDTGVERDTIRRWRDGKLPAHVDPEELAREIEARTTRLAEKWEQVADMAVDQVIELVPEIRDARAGAIVAAIATDKTQLLRGKPTSRVESSPFGHVLVQIRELLVQGRTPSGTDGLPEPPPAALPERIEDKEGR